MLMNMRVPAEARRTALEQAACPVPETAVWASVSVSQSVCLLGMLWGRYRAEFRECHGEAVLGDLRWESLEPHIRILK